MQPHEEKKTKKWQSATCHTYGAMLYINVQVYHELAIILEETLCRRVIFGAVCTTRHQSLQSWFSRDAACCLASLQNSYKLIWTQVSIAISIEDMEYYVNQIIGDGDAAYLVKFKPRVSMRSRTANGISTKLEERNSQLSIYLRWSSLEIFFG